MNSHFATAQIESLVAIARREVGVKEVGGNNRGPRIRQYQSATWLEPGAWPWCAAFVCWCIREWRQSDKSLPKFNRPQTAGAFDFERWARQENFPVFDETTLAKKGDIIVFDFSHIGIVAEDRAGDTLHTIEGNTNAEGSREGDGVWEKRRHWKLARSLIRFG
ncbi:MAG: CHAP domain-containing protein [bacterium]